MAVAKLPAPAAMNETDEKTWCPVEFATVNSTGLDSPSAGFESEPLS